METTIQNRSRSKTTAIATTEQASNGHITGPPFIIKSYMRISRSFFPMYMVATYPFPGKSLLI
jgi:hypothetical protein